MNERLDIASRVLAALYTNPTETMREHGREKLTVNDHRTQEEFFVHKALHIADLLLKEESRV